MVGFSYAQQQQILNKFLRAEIKNYETAAAIVSQKAGQRLKQETAKELRRFKKGKESRGNFHKAVKLYNFPKATKALPPTSYVRLGVPWIHIFEEGGIVSGKKGRLIILLPHGDKLGFKRVSTEGWQIVWNKIKDRAVIIPDDDGVLIGLKSLNPKEKPKLIYKIQTTPVYVPKKLNFYDNAEALADAMAKEIEKLVN